MKRVYETPRMEVEVFTANQAVSTCKVDKSYEFTFDCMYGPDVDKSSAIIATNLGSGCADQGFTKIGWAAGASTAYSQAKSNMDHSNHNSSIAEWSGSIRQGTLSVTYTGAEGLIYCDASGNGFYDMSHWSVATDSTGKATSITHDSTHTLTHIQVAPIIDTSSVKASW